MKTKATYNRCFCWQRRSRLHKHLRLRSSGMRSNLSASAGDAGRGARRRNLQPRHGTLNDSQWQKALEAFTEVGESWGKAR